MCPWLYAFAQNSLKLSHCTCAVIILLTVHRLCCHHVKVFLEILRPPHSIKMSLKPNILNECILNVIYFIMYLLL